MVSSDTELILERYSNEYAKDAEFIAEGLAIKITEEMLERLEKKGFNQSWLAEKMGVSRERISRILNARPNMTLLTIAKIAVALDVQPDVCLDAWDLSLIKAGSAIRSQKNAYVWAASEPMFPETPKPGKLEEPVTA